MDRAALDIALELGISCGGWCPKGRLAEDGAIPDRYPLQETSSSQYQVRTKRNVLHSDATLILNVGALDGGTALTLDLAHKNDRPCKVVDLDNELDITTVVRWLNENRVSTLNIAGPRLSKRPDIYEIARDSLYRIIREAIR